MTVQEVKTVEIMAEINAVCDFCGRQFSTKKSVISKRKHHFCSRECYLQNEEAKKKMAEQLCWSCSKACGGSDCPWANKLQPVEGWEAKKKIICGQKKPIETYHITKCPLYEKRKKE